MTEQFGYKHWALKYWSAKWEGVLPLPPQRKIPVPVGFSGHEGAYPSRDDIKSWIDNGFRAKIVDTIEHFTSDNANIAIRLPKFVVGIDVDFYGDKNGKATLEEAERRWGKLPATIMSTSRLDGVSGIRLFRVPEGTMLEEKIKFPELGLDSIEVCQYFHRFVVAYPSEHPKTNRRYHWVESDTSAEVDIPMPGELPMLPQEWINGLARGATQQITARADVESVLSELDHGPMSLRVEECFKQAQTELINAAGSRHDEIRNAQGRLFRLHHEDEAGVGKALQMLESLFIGIVTTDGSRSQAEAQSEWDRMISGRRIHDMIESTPSGAKANNAIMGLQDWQPNVKVKERPTESGAEVSWEVTVGEQSYENDLADTDFLLGNSGSADEYESEFDRELFGGGDVYEAPERVCSWDPQDLSDLLEEDDYEPEPATIGEREGGACLLYAGKVNALVAPPESAKSWVAQLIAAQEISKESNVMYFDFEDSKKGVVGRMRLLGMAKETIQNHFLYIDPKEALNTETRGRLIRHLDLYRPTLVVVDGLGAVMAMHNHEMKDNTEYIKFFQALLEPMTRGGAAVLVIDHVSKDSDESNNYAIGAQAKLQMITGVQVKVQAVTKFGKGKEGKLRLSINKDRHGGVRENSEFRSFKNKGGKGTFELDYWATVFVDARPDEETGKSQVRMTMRFESKEDAEAPNREGEIQSMADRVVAFVKENPNLGTAEICRMVDGNKDDVASGLSQAKHDQRIKSHSLGPGKKTVHWVEESDDPNYGIREIMGATNGQ